MHRVKGKPKKYKHYPWLEKETDCFQNYVVVTERLENGNLNGLHFIWNKKKQKWATYYETVKMNAIELHHWAPMPKPAWAYKVEEYLNAIRT